MNIRRCLLSSLAPSTLHTYRSGIRSYQQFCQQTSSYMFPLTEYHMQRYVVSMSNRLAFRSIKVYLSGVQFCSILIGSDVQLSTFTRLFYTLRGIRRLQGSRFNRPRRIPISYNQLLLLHCRLGLQSYTSYEILMLRCATALAYFGLLRCSEYTSFRRSWFDPDSTLLVTDISFNRDYSIMFVHIKSSKTDPFRVGCTIRVAAVSSPACPVRLMRAYLSSHPYSSGPLFVWRSRCYLIRSDVVLVLRRCFPDVPNINTHSFRIGGESAAASAGVPDSQIQILGRWSSDAYRRYIHVSDNLVLQLGQALTSAHTSTRVWDSLMGGSVSCLS